MAQQWPPKKATAFTLVFPIYDVSANLVSGATGLDSEISKDHAAYADCTSEAVEIGTSGTYWITLTGGAGNEMDADHILYKVTSTTTNAKPTVRELYTSANTGDEIGTSITRTGISKNVEFKLPFAMVLSSDRVTPATGKTVTVTLSKDSAAFVASANSPVEVSGGFYYIILTAAEMNYKTISLIFAATGCVQRNTILITGAYV